jgi:hypothetical protein
MLVVVLPVFLLREAYHIANVSHYCERCFDFAGAGVIVTAFLKIGYFQ